MTINLRLSVPVFAIAICLATPACTSVKIGEENTHNRLTLEVEPDEKGEVVPELGLALSGGGIRSALFSIGVLKSLYDQGILQKVNLISTVSGGSYAAYWLYSNELSMKSQREFGSASFSQKMFGQQMCELGTRGNFVTTWDYIKTGVTRTTYPDMYQDRIGRTFGIADEGPRRLSDIVVPKPSVLPYLIVNTTVVEPRLESGWAGGLFEMTPLHFGNEAFRYHRWNGQAPLYRTAVGASGAAVAGLLKRDFSLIREDGQPLDVVLADGGKSENLGAIALIRRGVKTIVIVDGEHDPDYEFPAYKNLKARLAARKYILSSDTIDTHLQNAKNSGKPPRLKTGLHLAYVTSEENKIVSRIYYLKMADAESIDPLLANEEILKAGEAFNKDYFKHLKDTATDNGIGRQQTWHCEQARDVTDHLDPWLKYTLNSYGRFAKRSHMFGLMHRIGGVIKGLDSNFPQYTTTDQSFYLDQNMAYIALGYFEGNELRGKIKIQPTEALIGQ